MNLIIGMESSGIVRDAFAKHGHEAWSCDLLPTERPGPHLQGNVFDYLGECQANNFSRWNLGIFHPDCTFMCSSGLHWNKRVPGRAAKTEEALEQVAFLMNQDIEKIAIENPIGCIGTRIAWDREEGKYVVLPMQISKALASNLYKDRYQLRKPDQIIQPHQFGEDASKATCLWLKNLPLLKPTGHFPPRIVNGRPRWGNQTDSGQNRLGPGEDRWKDRSRTYQGIADAMAEQWGNLF